MVKIRKIALIFAIFATLLVIMPISFAATISKFEAKTLANKVVRITFTVSNTSGGGSMGYDLFRGTQVLKQKLIDSDVFSDVYDDLDTNNGETYYYTLKLKDANSNVFEEKTVNATADSQPPQILTQRKITSKSNVLMIKTDEDAFCKAGFSTTNLFPMEGRSTTHTLKLGFIDGVNIVYVLCEDSFGNAMMNLKLFEYTYDSVAPGQIKNIDILNNIPGTVTLSWEPAKDANGIKEYRVYKYSELNDAEKFIGVSNLTYFYDYSGLMEGKTYYYKISAVDTVDNEGSKSNPKSILIYNSALSLTVPSNFTTKSGNVTITGHTHANMQVIGKLDSRVFETTSENNGDFSFNVFSEVSKPVSLEVFDSEGNSKLASTTIIRTAPDIEAQKTVLVREEKLNLSYIFLIAFLFFAIIFILVYATKRKNLYYDIDLYMKKKNKKQK